MKKILYTVQLKVKQKLVLVMKLIMLKLLPLPGQRTRDQGTTYRDQRGSRGRAEQPRTEPWWPGRSVSNRTAGKWGTSFKAGRVSTCEDEWADIISDYLILSNIRGYKLEFTNPLWQARPKPEIKFSKQEREFLKSEIKTLLQKGVNRSTTYRKWICH